MLPVRDRWELGEMLFRYNFSKRKSRMNDSLSKSIRYSILSTLSTPQRTPIYIVVGTEIKMNFLPIFIISLLQRLHCSVALILSVFQRSLNRLHRRISTNIILNWLFIVSWFTCFICYTHIIWLEGVELLKPFLTWVTLKWCWRMGQTHQRRDSLETYAMLDDV